MKTKDQAGKYLLGIIALSAALLAFVPVKAQAAETYISIPVATTHFGKTKPNGQAYNEQQLGTGIGFGQRVGDDWQAGYEVGTFTNSWDRRSNYAAVQFGYRFNDTVRAGVLVGAINGYGGRNNGAYAPLAAPQVEVKIYKRTSAVFTFVPTTVKGGSNAVALSLNYTF